MIRRAALAAATAALLSGLARADAPLPADAERLDQMKAEVARTLELERQIEAEVNRQEQLMQRMDKSEAGTAAPREPENLADRADPRGAPRAPVDRDLPLAIFEKKKVTIPKREWGNKRELRVVQYTLDADRDGNPEEIRYHDAETGAMVRMERDRDYDGSIDSWQVYEKGVIAIRTLDDSGDGKPDIWEQYASGRMVSREVDRDNDGVKDAFYLFSGDSLVEQRHDGDNDGRVDLIYYYEKRRRTRSEEDRNHNGKMDTWTTYATVNGIEVISRIERDTKDRGKPDLFETFRTGSGRPVIAKREEDLNGDGRIDITSIYKNGKLVKREISDPSLVPPS